MSRSMKERVIRWSYGLVGGAIGGGANAVTVAFASLVVDPKHFAAGSVDSLRLMGVTFLISGALSAFLYLKQSPLPVLFDDETRVGGSE